jgi:hypothetical protein
VSGFSEVDFRKCSAVCIVADRAHIPLLTSATDRLGGFWQVGATTFAAMPDFQFLALLATDRVRIKQRAPYILFGKGESELAQQVDFVCAQMSDVTCCWMKLLDEPALTLVSDKVLADTVVQGVA